MLENIRSRRLRLVARTITALLVISSLTACGWFVNFVSIAESSTDLNTARRTDFPNADPEIQQIIDGYALWTPVNPVAEYVMGSDTVAGLCRMPTLNEETLAQTEHGGLWLKVYVNQIGLAAMRQTGPRQFPVGTVIVKEKLLRSDDTLPFAVGMMIKRPSGSNPAGGDWEFLYQERAKPMARGATQLPNCQSCHVAQHEADGVFNIINSTIP